MAVYNTAKAQYDKDLQEYQAKKAQYDKDKEAYGKLVAKKAEELKLLINHKYFDTSKAIYANGSQAAQGVALYLGIVPKEYEQQVADNLSTMIKANKNLTSENLIFWIYY